MIPTWLLLGPRRLLGLRAFFLSPSPIHVNNTVQRAGRREMTSNSPTARATALDASFLWWCQDEGGAAGREREWSGSDHAECR
jgi:hypothetical protein